MFAFACLFDTGEHAKVGDIGDYKLIPPGK